MHEPPAHFELRALHALAKACANATQAHASLDCDADFWATRAQAAVAALLAGPVVGLAAAPYAQMPSAFSGATWCTASFITVSPSLAIRPRMERSTMSSAYDEQPLCVDELLSAKDDPFDLLVCATRCAAHRMRLDECLTTRHALGTVFLEAAGRRSHRRIMELFGSGRVLVLGDTYGRGAGAAASGGVSSSSASRRETWRESIRRFLRAPKAQPCAVPQRSGQAHEQREKAEASVRPTRMQRLAAKQRGAAPCTLATGWPFCQTLASMRPLPRKWFAPALRRAPRKALRNASSARRPRDGRVLGG